MTASPYPANLQAASWAALAAAHKAALAPLRPKADLGPSLKALERAHAAVDWDLFGCDGLDTAEDADLRKADLGAERHGPIKALLKAAEQVRVEAKALQAAFKADAALKGEPARQMADTAAAAEAYSRAVDERAEAAGKALEKCRLALLARARPGQTPAADPKTAKLFAVARSRLVAGLKSVRNPKPGMPPMKFIAAVAAVRARLAIGPNVGQSQKSQLLALLPGEDGIKWMKGECIWEDKAVTFVCATPVSGAGKRLQRGLLEQTRAKLRVRVRQPSGEAEVCDGTDDPDALQAPDAQASGGADAAAAGAAAAAPSAADAAALKARRSADEAMLKGRVDALLAGIARLGDAALRRDHAAQVVKLRQAMARLGALNDAAAVAALEAMGAMAADQQALVDTALKAQAATRSARTPAKPAKTGPRPRDLSDPQFAREVMALLTPEERASIKTRADYEWAIANYDAVMAIRQKLGPMPERMELKPTLDIRAPQILEEQAQARAQFYADRAFLRSVYTGRGLDPKEIDALDAEQVQALMWQFDEARRLAASPLANDGLGDSKGAVNHFLDGVEHGLGKLGHDIGNIGLAGKFTYDVATGKAPTEEPEWFGAAGRARGQNPSFGGLMWELAGNIPVIGRAQLLYGLTELGRGAWKGDWNNVAYGLGNLTGALMFGNVLGKAPLEPGKFADTPLGRLYEGGRSLLFDDSPGLVRSRPNPARLMPNDDGAHMTGDIHRVDVNYSGKTPGGLEVEVAPCLAGTRENVQPDLARRMHAAAKTVEGVLPPGRKIATPEGKPLSIVFDHKEPVPYVNRATGTVHMNPGLDAKAPFPAQGPGAGLARWAPKFGDPTASEIIMQHELGHAAMPEVGARVSAINQRKMIRAFMHKKGLVQDTPESRLTDARLAREEMLVNGLDELGADTIAVAAARDLQAMPKSMAHGLAQAVDAHAKDPSLPLPDEFPKNPVEWMRRRDFSDGGTIPEVGEDITPYDVFSGVRRHLGQHYGDALTGRDAPKVIAALMASNERFLKRLDAEPGLLDGDYRTVNALLVSLFDAEAARLGLSAKSRQTAPVQ